MRPLFSVVLLALVLLSQQVIPQTQSPLQSNAGSPAAGSAKAGKSKVHCSDRGTYVNNKGQTVRRPENCSGPPNGATAQCRDGNYSFSRSRRGTCSHHGGVSKWL